MKTIVNSVLKVIFITTLVFIFSGRLACGQDIIVMKTGDEIKAKVEQVLDTEIKYRKFDNLGGPVYSTKKAEVFMIRYENGSKDVFTSQTSPVITQPAQPLKPKFSYDDIKPAKTGAVVNYALIAPIMILGSLSAFSEDEDSNINFGIGATVVAGIGIPIGALLTGKTRRITGVEGNSGLRIAGWVSYGLTIADAITMLALSEEVDFSGGPTISVAVLGALSSVFLAIDGSQTAHQAESQLSRVNLQPTVGYVHDLYGNKYRTVGIRINF
jgi:hypothetical protein